MACTACLPVFVHDCNENSEKKKGYPRGLSLSMHDLLLSIHQHWKPDPKRISHSMCLFRGPHSRLLSWFTMWSR